MQSEIKPITQSNVFHSLLTGNFVKSYLKVGPTEL